MTRRLRPLLATLALLVAVPAAARAETPQDLENAGVRDIIVMRAPGLSAPERGDLRDAADVTHVRTMQLDDTEVVRARPGELTEALSALQADPDVVFAEVDAPVRATTNDSYWNLLWGLENTGQTVLGTAGTVDADIDAPAAWSTSTGAGATVGVVDTGVQQTHPDLAGRITGNPGEIGGGKETNGIDDDANGKVDDWRGWDFVSGDNLPQDGNGHGTHVSGTIAAAANNGTGVAGVAPDAKVIALRALDDAGSGTSSNVADAFSYAGALGLRVVNASLGSDGSSVAISSAIASHPNTLYVVAAGNDGRDVQTTPSYPCSYGHANILCVGATDSRDLRASFSNYGATSVDVFAPGVSIASTYPTNSYVYSDGTSMASPHAAGVAALAAAANGTLTTAQLKAAIMAGVDAKASLSGLAVSGGRINAAATLGVTPDAGSSPAPTPTPTPAPAPTPAPTTPPVAQPPADADDGDAGDDDDAGDEDGRRAVLRLQRRGSTKLCLSRSRCRSRSFQVRFTLDEAERVTTAYERHVCKRGGRKRGRKTRSTGCSWRAVARRSLSGREGTNRLKVTTKVGRKKLAAGSYRLTLDVTTDDVRRTGSVRFSVR